jgi:hypothetical protein
MILKIRRCLIVNCSKTKIGSADPIQAVKLYDGPAFRVIRKYLRSLPQDALDIYVLSAKHGLIAGDSLIHTYDEHITPQKAAMLNPEVLQRFKEILSSGYDEVFALISKEYLGALQGYEQYLKPSLKWSLIVTSEGKRLRALKTWLYGEENLVKDTAKHIPHMTGHAVLKGREIQASPKDIMELALRVLQEERCAPYRLREWFVLIGSERISPKWLVSKIFGISVSEFQANDARRVLSQLGIKVEHV